MNSSTKQRQCAAIILLASSSASTVVAAAPIERQLDIRMTMTGTQSWKNGLQSYEGTTTQDYDLGARLRSDGVLYRDNLLDTNLENRLTNKQQYYTLQGLRQLVTENGGKMPKTAQDLATLKALANKNAPPCVDEFDCNNAALHRFAAISALDANTPKEIEDFLGAPGGSEEPRFLYFFGYAGCPTRIHITYEVHIAGTRAYDRDKKKIVPWLLDRSANTQGSELERKTLCEKYVATLNTKTGAFYLENLFIPSPPGTSTISINGQVEKQMRDLPPPPVVLDWTSAKLRQSKESGNEKVVLDMTLPLDGDSTMLGDITGKLNLNMSWSFKPVAAPAVTPAPKPVK